MTTYEIQRSLNAWLKENWLFLVTIAAVIGWGWNVEAKIKDRYTASQARSDQERVFNTFYEEIRPMRENIEQIREDVAYLKGRAE